MRRGEIWWADLGEPRKREPAFRRPVLIVQDDLLTDSRLGTVMVVPLTSSTKRAEAAGNVELPPEVTHLPRTSVALVCQVMTIDKDWLSEQVGVLPRRTMHRVDAGLRLALGLAI